MTQTCFTNDIDRTAACLMAGGLAIVPTDTVYGLAASITSQAALEQIFISKCRPVTKPLPLLVANQQLATRLTSNIPATAKTLMDAFWPGALTLVLPAAEEVPALCRANGNTVGLRMPDHRGLITLLEACGGMLAVTSANRSGEPESTSARDAFNSLPVKPDVVLDLGNTPGGIASTVVDTTSRPATILRRGAVQEAAIRRKIRTL